jgi:hypothetical protein
MLGAKDEAFCGRLLVTYDFFAEANRSVDVEISSGIIGNRQMVIT